jgi:hypothetical protein
MSAPRQPLGATDAAGRSAGRASLDSPKAVAPKLVRGDTDPACIRTMNLKYRRVVTPRQPSACCLAAVAPAPGDHSNPWLGRERCSGTTVGHASSQSQNPGRSTGFPARREFPDSLPQHSIPRLNRHTTRARGAFFVDAGLEPDKRPLPTGREYKQPQAVGNFFGRPLRLGATRRCHRSSDGGSEVVRTELRRPCGQPSRGGSCRRSGALEQGWLRKQPGKKAGAVGEAVSIRF